MLLQTLASQVRAAHTFDDHGGGGGAAVTAAALPPPPLLPSVQVCTLLKMNLQMLAAQGLALHPSAALRLLETGSPFSNLRLHPCQAITSSVAATYVYFLQHGCEKVAVESALCLKREIETLSRSLAGKKGAMGLVEAEVVSLLKFDLLLLLMSVRANAAESQVQKVKSIINFVLEKSDPFEAPVRWHSELQLAVVQALRRVFSWIVPWEVDAEGAMEFFGKCSVAMARGLEKGVASLTVRIEVLEWVGEFPKWFRKLEGMTLLSSSLFVALVAAASDEEHTVRLQASKTFGALLRHKCLSSSQLYSVASAAFEQLGDPDPGIQAAFREVLATCALGALWVHGWNSDLDAKEEGNFVTKRPLEREKHWRSVLSANRFALQLSPPQVVCILNYISQRPQSLPAGWQQRLVFNCLKTKSADDKKQGDGLDRKEDFSVVEDAARFDLVESWCCSSNMAAAWFIIQELARHCITVRFRTHLGGPTQTFAALERMLLDLPQLVQSESSAANTSELLPMRLLLELVDSLQRNIYNAYEGSLVLEAPSFSSGLFFRANKKVCEEWFARIREALVNASSVIQCHFGTAQHALFRLHDLRPMALAALRDLPRSQAADGGLSLKVKLQQDVFRVLRHGSLALCKLHESDSILGLQAWAVTAFAGLILEDVHKVSSPLGPVGWMNGLAFEARGEFERAAAHYSQLFQSEETLSVLGADGVQFIIGRIVESYVSLSDWEALEGWLQELQVLRAKHAGKSYTGALTTAGIDMNSIHALSRFDASDMEGTWGYLDLTPQSNNEITIDPRQALQRSEQMLLQAMLRKDSEVEDAAREVKLARAMLDGPLLVSSLDDLSDAAPYLTQLHCIEVVESWKGPSERQEGIQDISLKYFNHPADEVYQDCHLWLKVLRVYKTVFPHAGVTSTLRRQLIRLARKHGNFRLARRMLKEMDGENWDSKVAAYENSLLHFSEGQHAKAMTELWPLVKNFIAESERALPFEGDVMAATSCLKLGSWLQKRRTENDFAGLLSEMDLTSGSGGMILEEVAGAAVKAATLHCPSFGKAWFSYASWCYSLARCGFFGNETLSKASIFPQVLEKELISSSPSLTDEEMMKIQAMIKSLGSELEDAILEMLVKRVVFLLEAAAREAGFEKWDGESLSLQLRQELQVLKPSSVPGLINELLQVWWGVRKRRISLFGYAAHGFLKYMSLSNRTTVRSNPLKQDSTLSASLFVLNILQTCGVELEDILQQGLSSIPPSPWKEITPQLFACVSSHPEAKVRKQLEGLLMSLANVYPWAIVYPTLVHFNASEGQSSEELERILNSLSKLHPKVVNDVRLMIAELGSITFLWEEQWLTTLQDLHADVTRRIITLKEEAARIAENQTLSPDEKTKINAAKYAAIMAPVSYALERRLTLTSRPAETPHEVWFQEHFGGQLRAAITTFKTPPGGNITLNDVWKPFDAIAASLSNHHKRSAVVLQDVSPRLAALTHSDAPMPGLEFPDADLVTVANFNDQITILATKTKPKKVSVTGSDGQVYNYLLKGREDLRLDARIMQLLRASNKMLRASSATRREGLAVKCYSVTPISGRAGLIQWVDNVTSLYSVYKAWQLRQQAAQLSSNAVSGAPPPLPRPSDMFYGKIIPALKEKGLRKVISRRDWPQDVKRKVLLDLMKETPRQLLYRELWCASDGLKGLNKKIKRFSGSVAVMSVIGHVLGLGDRHLDNILIDFSSGDVVHIDYNICFEKGRRLKVPEIVPFRLTQTIQNALGPTGVEGFFRASCEAVLSVLQKNKEVILMLLEAFVWDPLVEWMRGDGHDEATIGGEERKGMELAVSLSLFASHVQENRVALQEHHDQLLRTLPTIPSTLQSWAAGYENFERCSTLAYHINQKKYAAENAEVAARNLLAEASGSLEKTHVTYEIQAREFAQSKARTAEAARETTQWIEQRSRVLDSLRTDTAPELQALGQRTHSTEAVSLLQAIVASGVALTVLPEPTQVHFREVDRDISQFTSARHEALLHARATLQAYAVALQRLLPGNYYTTSYVHSWAKILQLLSMQVTPEVLGVTKRQAIDITAGGRGDHDDVICQKHEKLRSHVELLGEEVQKLEQGRLQLEESVDPDAEKRAKDKLMGIFLRSLQQGKKDEDDAGLYDFEERRLKVILVLQSAASTIYSEIGNHAANLQGVGMEESIRRWCFPELEGLVERAVLVSDVLNELQQFSGKATGYRANPWDSNSSFTAELKGFTDCLAGIDHLVKQMIGVVLPEAVKAALSQDPAVMDAFASLSQIRGAIDTTLEKVAEIEMQKSALLELERTYPDRLEELVKRKTFLEEAAAGGKDDLSWEEAEELASQEDLCREQLETLQKAWSQRSAQASAVLRMEGLVRSALASADQRFEALVALDRDDLHLMRGKVLLAAFAKLFSGLESLDAALRRVPVAKTMQVESPGLEYIWRASNVLQKKTFFVWKVYVMDILLDSCVRDASNDLSLSLDQVISQHKRRLEAQLQGVLDLYLRERVSPAFLDIILKEATISSFADNSDSSREGEAAKKAVKLLREYCDVHETVRAAKSAAFALKIQADEAKQSLQNAQIEIAQMEWLHETVLLPRVQFVAMPSGPYPEKSTSIRWWSRKQILDNIRNSIAAISRATEGLQKAERASVSAEEQLERTMAWASNRAGTSQEFRERLQRRQQLLWTGQEHATSTVRLCVTVLEFEASREGYLESSSSSSSSDGKSWQQSYQSLILRLEAAYIAFTSCDMEWKAAQKALEAASANLSGVLRERQLVSSESESSGAELQSIFLQLRQLTLEAAGAVNAFCKVVRSHSALTSEGAVMLDEVLALTEGADGVSDVHSLAKEAITERQSLISDLKKVHAAVAPLELLLSSTANAMSADLDVKAVIKSGQSPTLQSLDLKIKESLADLPLHVSSVLDAAQKLHSALTSLGRTASVDAGTLNKAFEGMDESPPVSVSTEDVFPSQQSNLQPVANPLVEKDVLEDDDSWISPPGTQSGDSDYSVQESTSTQDHEVQQRSQAENVSVIKALAAEAIEGQTRAKAGVSQHSLSSECDKLHSGEAARPGNDQKQHTLKGNSSNALSANVDHQSRVVRGTAVNVLKRVRTKLEGRDIDETGQLSIADQVDHLLRQAMSIDNLCNMYEGWTPWI
ncbi:serine/threonine-protein kinase SMG1 [Selaginella moellendorffii]|uniref:serine/threonine-protein kinase SMG1 n=1 Tax=Selaginella moellendorffii TaxID=88036 RepID=UPI000D1C2707|nr:serine/threonine-protein kinase SMG1 [Selaginella moellendorffii]XP_024528272.1 serine/threonine-protein kinase SMG1 [Selaginella moellendorffii]XP_024528273.1 serine/threonine-protein kinase SMG1 [Selaginella moellendorffii]|eukprot:XP_024528271.1 serine/threonine-protein kinase SMG1 [Selaginella moellendorffii]